MDEKLSRKDFLKGSGAAAAAAASLSSLYPGEFVSAQDLPRGGPLRRELLAQCPDCGVGCSWRTSLRRSGTRLWLRPR